LATWSDDLKRLTQKDIDDGLLKELEEMGPSAANEIAALNQLTGAQLDQYVALWKKKNELARTQATKELEPLREDTNKQIDQLRIDTAKKLDEYKAEWAKKISEIRVGTSDEMVGLTTDMNKIGADAIKGLQKGLADQEGPLYDQVKAIADGIAATIKKTLKIKSPSRVMMGLGKFAGEGLANGLISTSKTVAQKSKELASSAVSSINDFLSTFQQPNFDNEIHLRVWG
jgi:ClpP class serine protease